MAGEIHHVINFISPYTLFYGLLQMSSVLFLVLSPLQDDEEGCPQVSCFFLCMSFLRDRRPSKNVTNSSYSLGITSGVESIPGGDLIKNNCQQMN
jgi:hypothetical protein